MAKPRKRTAKRPATDAEPTSYDPHAEMLRLLTNDKASLRRRFMMAKSALKAHLYREEALHVIRLVARREGFKEAARDLATRLLLKHAAAKHSGAMLLPVSWKGLLTALPKHKWIPDDEFMRTPKKDKFPDLHEIEQQNGEEE